jgi:SAM-dependent methyltransferase
LAEFTGERVIPGLVDPDLLNEHLARYRFAARLSEGAAVLDAGCGSGYGTAEFAHAASVTGTDISAEALGHARSHFARPGVRFVQAACEAMPFADAAFDLITAFEVIEHLERWPELLSEARRVLRPGGVLLVSTPNKAYYNEMRAAVGPNPFHCHEFEYEEFQAALRGVFPHVRLWAQNHVEAIVFAPADPGKAALEAGGNSSHVNAHFFLAACSTSPVEVDDVFAWLPSSGNVLREREHHIGKLEGELARKDAWLEELKTRHGALHKAHEAALEAVRERTLWAEELNLRVRDRDQRIGELQTELEAQQARASEQIDRLEAHLLARTEWARSLDAQLAERTAHVLLQTREIEEYIERLKVQTLQLEELKILRQRLALIAQSRWVRLGRTLNVGPAVDSK